MSGRCRGLRECCAQQLRADRIEQQFRQRIPGAKQQGSVERSGHAGIAPTSIQRTRLHLFS